MCDVRAIHAPTFVVGALNHRGGTVVSARPVAMV
jgi:hypothetical protein